jgi:anthranilate/para-aminobenzoate synthase component II/chorismate mutase
MPLLLKKELLGHKLSEKENFMILIINNNYNLPTDNFLGCLKEMRKTKIEITSSNTQGVGAFTDINPSFIIILSGAQRPSCDTGSREIIRKYGVSVPILEITTGYPSVLEELGCTANETATESREKNSRIIHTGEEYIFNGIPVSFTAMCSYTSVIDSVHLSGEIIPIAFSTDDFRTVAIKHSAQHIYAMQVNLDFLCTSYGMTILKNFFSLENDENVIDSKGVGRKKLSYIRNNIDEIDRQIIRLFSHRYKHVKDASNYKNSVVEVIAEKRIQDVLNKVRNTADKEKIDPDLVVKIYDFLVHSFIDIEKQEYKKHN